MSHVMIDNDGQLRQTMRSMSFHGSKLKSGALVLVFCPLIVIGVAMVAAALSSPAIGYGRMIMPLVLGSILIITGLLCVYAFAIQLLRRGPVVTIVQRGILDVRNGVGLISWADICSLRKMRRSSRLNSRGGIDYIGVYLHNPTPYLLRLPGWKRRLTLFGLRQGMPFAEISFLGLTPGVEAALTYLRETSPSMLQNEL